MNSNPVVAIETRAENSSPEEILEAITVPLENAVYKLPGIKTVRSSSLDDRSLVEVEYASTPSPECVRQVQAAVLGAQVQSKGRALASVVSVKPRRIP